jgi:hypothetical protein
MVYGNIACMMIDVEEVSIDLLEICMMRYARNADSTHRFLSNLPRIDRYTAEIAIRRRNPEDSDHIIF